MMRAPEFFFFGEDKDDFDLLFFFFKLLQNFGVSTNERLPRKSLLLAKGTRMFLSSPTHSMRVGNKKT